MTRSTAAASARFRQRKLSTKHPLHILRESDIDHVDDEAQRNVPKVETGVEKGEEIEHHLQAALSASQANAVGGKVAQIYIPTPDAIQSTIQYERLYSLTFNEPITYIRFSSTVEDCCGCPYDLDDEDDAYLQSYNKTRDASTQCSEDHFEETMSFFEENAHIKQPYAAVDSPPVLTFEEFQDAFEEDVEQSVRHFAKDIYEHWKRRRLQAGNKTLVPSLKFETGAETDESDPYVCFRRREVRQIRKTRGRDAHSAEKLKKLRKELEESRQILALIKQREVTKKEQLDIDRQLFEQRASLRQLKVNLAAPYKEGDEDLLLNQKKRKQPAGLGKDPSVPAIGLPPRSNGRAQESELVQLREWAAEKENWIANVIKQRVAAHRKWNEGWVDYTRAPLTPPSEVNGSPSFRTAVTEYLPTPPASASSEQPEGIAMEEDSPRSVRNDPVSVRYASPSYDDRLERRPSFRRRYGRGGRLFIDRRHMKPPSLDTDHIDDITLDRMKFDCEDSDEEQTPTYRVDPHSDESIWFRAKISLEMERVQMMRQARERERLAQQQHQHSSESQNAQSIG